MSGDSRVSGPELAHHGITVADLDASASFFTDVLGMSARLRIDLGETFSAGVTGVTGVTGIDGARLSVAFVEGPGLTVELLQYHGPADRTASAVRSCDAGSAHLALYVDDVQDLVERAELHGWHPAGVVQRITVGLRARGRAV